MADDIADAGDGADLETNPSEPLDVEERLSKLEQVLSDTAKALEDERKASAGKDKKITELSAKTRKLQETTLSKEQLWELREEELKAKEAEWAEKNATERVELEQLRRQMTKTKVLGRLEGFPMSFATRVSGNTEEEIEADARAVMRDIIKERDLVNNKKSVTGAPKVGAPQAPVARTADLPTDPDKLKEFGKAASDEDFLAMQDALQKEAQ